MLVAAVADGCRQLVMGELPSQIADIVSEVMQTEDSSIMAEVLRTQNAAMIRHSLA